MTSNIKVLERIIKLMPLASKDETRSHLCGVHLVAGAKASELIIEVTDGHRLIKEVVQIEDYWLEVLSGYEHGILIERNTVNIKTLKHVLKEHRYSELTFSFDGNSFSMGGLTGTWTIPVQRLDRYPNTTQLIPNRGKHCVTFNAQYLLDIAKAISNPRSMGVSVWFDINMSGEIAYPVVDNLKPLVITGKIDGKERSAVLMPMRGN